MMYSLRATRRGLPASAKALAGHKRGSQASQDRPNWSRDALVPFFVSPAREHLPQVWECASMARKTTVGDVKAEVLAYTSGQDRFLDLALVEADCLGTAAHVAMLARMPLRPPLMTPHDARRVVAELKRIAAAAAGGKFAISLEDQDVHLAVERWLTKKLGDLGKRVHACRSRNDQVAVDLRLYAKSRLLEAMAAGTVLIRQLLSLAREHKATPMVGRTHMQPAMPSSLGLWASAWAEGLTDNLAMLRHLYDLNNRCPLGSAASYGVPLPMDRQFVSDCLGFERPVHTFYANQARGQLEAAILFGLGQVMLTLSRLAQDIILFSMPEFGYFRLPAGSLPAAASCPKNAIPMCSNRCAPKPPSAGHAHAAMRSCAGCLGLQPHLQEIKCR